MNIKDALIEVKTTEALLQAATLVNNPSLLSKHMMRLSQSTSIAEEYLAEYERDYQEESARLYKHFLIDEKLAATNAEKRVSIELGELKGQIAYLTRVVSSSWKLIGVTQSRINHIVKFSETTNL